MRAIRLRFFIAKTRKSETTKDGLLSRTSATFSRFRVFVTKRGAERGLHQSSFAPPLAIFVLTRGDFTFSEILLPQ